MGSYFMGFFEVGLPQGCQSISHMIYYDVLVCVNVNYDGQRELAAPVIT